MASPADIQLLCLDVDGVLTDGSIVLDDNGVESKRFHVRDGTGIRMWLKLGLHVALITGRTGQAVQHRARELGIKHVVQGCTDKCAEFRTIVSALDLQPRQAAMVGDDVPDLPLMKLVGYPIAVADAIEDVRAVAKFTTSRPGGQAAVREAIEHLLRAKNLLAEAHALFG